MARRCFSLISLVAIIFGLAFLVQLSQRQLVAQTIGTAISKANPPKHGYFHLLMPADRGDANVCKSVLGAAILGYPTPTIYNWIGDNHDRKRSWSPEQMEKIFGMHRHLQTMDNSTDHDLLLLVDSYDTWFQLNPQILIDRYHETNRGAEERMNINIGNTDRDFKQTIVLSAEKKCWPGSPNDLGCFAVPESPVPRFIYGPQTDVDVGGPENPFLKFRRRHLNSGFMLGPVKDLRTLFSRANTLAAANPNDHGGDQSIIAQIFGEQEYVRELSRLPHPVESDSYPQVHETFTRDPSTNYEFHLGLDYAAALSVPTKWSDNDSSFLNFTGNTSLATAPSGGTYRLAMQSDILASDLPLIFAVTHPTGESVELAAVSRTPKDLQWKDFPLYTDIYTHHSPALIHHNGDKSARENLWQRLWYQPIARGFLDIRLGLSQRDSEAIAVDSEGKKWYARAENEFPEATKLGVKVLDKEARSSWVTWNALCDPEAQEEVFKDGKGVYQYAGKKD